MPFSTKQINYGVLRIQGKNIKIYETASVFSNLTTPKNIKDARWTSDTLTVWFMDGTIRKYTGISNYTNIMN